MRRWFRVAGLATAVLFVSIAIAASVSARGPQDGVRLHVIDADSGVPVAHARLASLSTTPLAPAMTDLHGDVTVDVPVAGSTVRVAKAGYAPQSIQLQPTPDVVQVALPRGAAIGGRVLDSLGTPVAGRAVRVTSDQREPQRRPVMTNDLGEYRVGALAEATYRVSLVPASNAEPGIEHTVVVRRGDEVSGIDFTTAGVTCPTSAPLPAAARGFIGASIQGRVVGPGGAPLPCVDVVAYRGLETVAGARTTSDGFYVLRGLRAGAYSLEFKRPGYVSLQWGQQQPGQPGRQVSVRGGEQRRNVDIRLVRGGVITGTLLDEFLEPAENVTVRAFELRAGDERTVAVAGVSAVTDDRGRYRLPGLLPGPYFVGTAASTERPDAATGKGYAPAYYPGVTEIASARPLDVREEQERPFIDFPREPTRVATITGFALNSRNEPVTEPVILVASQRSGAVIAGTQSGAVHGLEGAFEISNVPPGDYVVQATSKRGEGESPEFGMQYVSVYQDDPPPVRIKTAPGLDVRGKLTEDGLPPIAPGSFALTAIPTDWDRTSVLAGIQTVTPADDGTFLLEGVTGSRRFVLTTAPSNWYLKAIRLRGQDVTDAVTGFPMFAFGFVRDLEVVVSNKGASIDGEVMDGSTPAAEFSVILFSSNPDRWFRSSRFLKTVHGDSRGRFRMEGIADDDYFVAAVDPLDGSAGGAWQDHDFLQSLTVSARRVRLREGDSRSLTLTMTHP
jgi:hypothetical protein